MEQCDGTEAPYMGRIFHIAGAMFVISSNIGFAQSSLSTAELMHHPTRTYREGDSGM